MSITQAEIQTTTEMANMQNIDQQRAGYAWVD
jgi:hypothetical protein